MSWSTTVQQKHMNKPNQRAGVDAGLGFLFALESAWPGTTQRERYAARNGHTLHIEQT